MGLSPVVRRMKGEEERERLAGVVGEKERGLLGLRVGFPVAIELLLAMLVPVIGAPGIENERAVVRKEACSRG